MSAWASLVTRAQLQAGETVLINGATGSAGQLAVQIARYLGAKKSLRPDAMRSRWRRSAPMNVFS
jgi:NADPH:quinone reductase-like Zn-dependent oxidoreductase